MIIGCLDFFGFQFCFVGNAVHPQKVIPEEIHFVGGDDQHISWLFGIGGRADSIYAEHVRPIHDGTVGIGIALIDQHNFIRLIPPLIAVDLGIDRINKIVVDVCDCLRHRSALLRIIG